MSRYLSSAFAGTGGTIKKNLEDFHVEEIPLYQPCGEGEHLYLRIEKRGLTTFDLLRRLAGCFGVKERELGYAGLKDARATTIQTVSVPACAEAQLPGLEIEGVTILSAERHRNKLRTGHLAGNRFTIRIRNTVPGALERARDILHVLEQTGVPNRFGAQRYGILENSHLIGRAIVGGDFATAAREIVGDPARIVDPVWRRAAQLFREGRLAEASTALPGRMRDEKRMLITLMEREDARAAILGLPRKLLRLYLSAYQSHLFDRLVEMRLDSLDVVWLGDLAYKHDNGACFSVTDPAAEQERADRFEISPSGPLCGYKTKLATAQAGLLEESLLESEGIRLEDFRLGGGLKMEGERRALRVPLTEVRTQEGETNDLLLSFTLPRGSFATSVLAEVMKPGPENTQGD